ncbi:MAG: TIGR04002 family protein [Oscillospiraceae bacterium]|nr:TIGR04002 family protein [Oscillospiraceae bacterium]
MALTALFAALTATATAFIKINTGINEGYIHFGDSIIYLGACILPLPYACLAAAIGGSIADLLSGAAVWAPITAVIKALNVLPFAVMYSAKITKNPNKIVNKATAAMPVFSGIITVFGYLVAESLMYNFASALTSVPFSIIQAVGSATLFWLLGALLDRINFKNRLFK